MVIHIWFALKSMRNINTRMSYMVKMKIISSL